mmetsp:Transcript_7580/g.11086  ORF Transcript_7580/g.11086 Transcript_7580/m.11086 type:complete len:500 (-) Transcript_7580:1202-2701(-)
MFTNDSGKDDNVPNATIMASPYGNTSTVVQSGNAQGENPFLVKKQPTKCNDPLFAVLLYVNVAAIIGVTIAYGTNPFTQVDDANNDADSGIAISANYSAIIKIAIATASFASVLSGIALQIMMCIPGILIKAALLFNVLASALVVIFGVVTGQLIIAIVGFIFFALMACYAKLVWSRIPFATANLKTGCAAIRANCGVTLFAYAFTMLGFGWSILWSLAVAGVQDKIVQCQVVQDANGNDVNECTDPNYGLLFLLFLSFFFTHQVIQNCVHCTVAGTVGSWWFTPQSSGFCSSAVCGSFFRTVTTSFGSICFGSLLVAIIQAVRQLAETARQNEEYGQMLACCVDCILGCLQSIIEYFNKWAFVYVGLYGYGYCEAGKSVIDLFKDRGWEAIIADDLVGMVLGLMSLVVGLLTGAAGLALEKFTDWFDDFTGNNGKIFAFVLGLVIGLVLCSILMSTIASAVNSSIVLFAEGPAEFEQNHQELSTQMREAYLKAYPGCM